MTDYKKEIDGNELFKRIAGHSYYKGDDILTRISLMQEGKLPKNKDIKPADVQPVVMGKWIVKKTHLFDLNDRGEPDMFAFEYEYHNGPHCKKCGRFICEHCEPDYAEQECEKEHFECPFCKRAVLEKENFCPNCGADMCVE
jgi:hypothetical protein